jgi:hypothetical protein
MKTQKDSTAFFETASVLFVFVVLVALYIKILFF